MTDLNDVTKDDLECGGDAIRRHEQGYRELKLWVDISESARKKWRAKASSVLWAVVYERERVKRIAMQHLK